MEASHPEVRTDSLSLTEYTYEQWLMSKKRKEKKTSDFLMLLKKSVQSAVNIKR